MNDDSFETMRDIGQEYGLTSHKLGKFLTEQGFREGGRPTAKAHHHGWVKQRFAPEGTNYIWAWHVGNVRVLLESLGYERQQVGDGEAKHPASL